MLEPTQHLVILRLLMNTIFLPLKLAGLKNKTYLIKCDPLAQHFSGQLFLEENTDSKAVNGKWEAFKIHLESCQSIV